MQHKDAPTGHMHIIHNFEFATVEERNSYTPTSEDLNKICLVNNPYCFYALKNVDPIEWRILGEVVVNVGNLDVYTKAQSEERFMSSDEVIQLLSQIKDKNYRSATNPTTKINPDEKGALWTNYKTNDIFICNNNEKDKNIWTSIKTGKIIAPAGIYTFDTFGDSSATGLFKLESNTTDEGAKSTITLTNMSYVDGIVGQGILTKDTTSAIDLSGNIRTISMFIKLPTSMIEDNYFFDNRKYGYTQYCYLSSAFKIKGLSQATISQDGVNKAVNDTLITGKWTHLIITLNSNVVGAVLLNYFTDWRYGIKDVTIDQIRCFNRVLTSSEITKLKEEIVTA